MLSDAVPAEWRSAFEARLRTHDDRLAHREIGISQMAWEVRDSDDPVACADRTFCTINSSAAEWVRRCMRHLLWIDPAIDKYDAYDLGVRLWVDYENCDPKWAACELRPLLAAGLGSRRPVEPDEGPWVERFMTRLAQMSEAGEVDPVEAAERAKWAWLNMTTSAPESVAEELYGDLSMRRLAPGR